MDTSQQKGLVKGDQVLASIDVADGRLDRLRGLLGRDRSEAAILLPKTRSVHTVGMRYAIDVAFCDRDLVVRRLVTLRPWRVTAPRPGEHCVVEVEAGAFELWGVEVGDRLEVR